MQIVFVIYLNNKELVMVIVEVKRTIRDLNLTRA